MAMIQLRRTPTLSLRYVRLPVLRLPVEYVTPVRDERVKSRADDMLLVRAAKRPPLLLRLWLRMPS